LIAEREVELKKYKNMKNNPYILEVKNHPKILTELETEIYPIK